MPHHLLKLDSWISRWTWPALPCPECGEGTLGLEEDLLTLRDPISQAFILRWERGQEAPDSTSGACSGQMTCSRPQCKRAVLFSGDWKNDRDDDEISRGWIDYIRVRYISPALPIITPPAKTPKKVSAAIQAASELIWINPNAAANQLRQAIEELLTYKRVKRTIITRKHKLKRLSAHERITIYRDANPATNTEVADTLEAVKWIGNSGSHESALTVAGVLEGAELLQHALIELFDRTAAQRRARVKQINARRGIPRPKN